MQTVAWQSSVYVLLLSHAACFLYWLDNWPCAQAPRCVCVILISFHASGKAPLALRCLSSFHTYWRGGLWNELCGLFANEGQIHFTAFDLWVNNLQTKTEKKEREKSAVDVRAVEPIRKKGKAVRARRLTGTESRGDKLWRSVSLISMRVTKFVLPLQDLLQRQCNVCLIIRPIIFQAHFLSSLCRAHSYNVDLWRVSESATGQTS